jgi:glucose/arabinose dehydrogenase
MLLSALLILTLNPSLYFNSFVHLIFAQPSISDTKLNVRPVVENLSAPTDMIFLDKNNILVLEQEGNVRLVTNGTLQDRPVFQVPVNTTGERGLLGIAISPASNSSNPNIFLYYTEEDPIRNRIYKFQWNGETLINPKLILDLPAFPDPFHNGGKIIIGPDGYLYAVIGDLHFIPDGYPPEYTGRILRISPIDGSAVHDNPFASNKENDMSKYYAYGIRNSFGMDFDPVTGNLWDTENGPLQYDEINLVKPGFNSGYYTVMGPISLSGKTEDDLLRFPNSHYSDPLFSWNQTVAPTGIEFFNSSKLGERYANNIFVGDVRKGNLYFFELNENRDGIELNTTQQKSGLFDFVVDSEEELSSVVFGSGFGGITDIETGPDGFLYLLSYYNERESPFLNLTSNNNGTIYKISSSNMSR